MTFAQAFPLVVVAFFVGVASLAFVEYAWPRVRRMFEREHPFCRGCRMKGMSRVGLRES